MYVCMYIYIYIYLARLVGATGFGMNVETIRQRNEKVSSPGTVEPSEIDSFQNVARQSAGPRTSTEQ